MGNYISSLLRHLFTRRAARIAESKARPDHPERLPVDRIQPNETTRPKWQCSDFYLFCRNGDVENVRRSLPGMPAEDIDRMEPNGSTALHAACYHGHEQIVELLLQAGADRSIQNKFNYLPYDEASTEKIKALFLREPSTNRLVSNTGLIEWQEIGDYVKSTAENERFLIESLYTKFANKQSVRKMFEAIEQVYMGKVLKNFDKIASIGRFFHKATEEEDPIWLLKAYTAETDFYKALNTEIACGAGRGQMERRYLIALLCHHPKLDRLTYTGVSYRVIRMSTTDQEAYQVGGVLMTKAFLSTSIDDQAVAGFVCQQESLAQTNTIRCFKSDGTAIRSWVLCKYTVKRHRTALHIEDVSQYTPEAEVLIMPYTLFEVTKIDTVQPSYLPPGQLVKVIEMSECIE